MNLAIATHFAAAKLGERMSHSKNTTGNLVACGPLILTFAGTPAATGCKC
jgi:hypothetical protein